jgi:hypothetical protein
MTVEEIRELARERKLIYAEWLSDLKAEQGEILLSAIRDALQYENGRAEHLDTKGNYILAAGLAGLAAMTAVSKPVLEDLRLRLSTYIQRASVNIARALWRGVVGAMGNTDQGSVVHTSSRGDPSSRYCKRRKALHLSASDSPLRGGHYCE